MLIDLGLASRHLREELVALIHFFHRRELHLNCADLMAQLLVAQITRVLVGLDVVVYRRYGRDRRLGLRSRSDSASLLKEQLPIVQ